jgi:hypothetical protein
MNNLARGLLARCLGALARGYLVLDASRLINENSFDLHLTKPLDVALLLEIVCELTHDS